MKGDALLQGEIKAKEYRFTEIFLKFSPEPLGQIQSNFVQIILR
jgi:hypothetical protein